MFLTKRHYRAPSGDGDKLIDPPAAEVPRLLAAAKHFDLPGQLFDGMSLPRWRELARREVLQLLELKTQPTAWLVAGHQPELFHPGVWLKNFVMGRLAQEQNAIALNLVVDNDVPKSAAIRVPVWRRGIKAKDVTIKAVPFDAPPGDVPYEEWLIRDREAWTSFPERLREATKEWQLPPIGVPGWNGNAASVSDALVSLRRQQEEHWGLHNAELTVSRLCLTAAFKQFVETIVANLPRFHACYNDAVRAYRNANKIKSRHHPVPDLAEDGDWLEAPFWCWTSDEPRRQRPFIRRAAKGLRLRWGDHESAWPDASVKLRPRALTLTLFVRLVLADMFIHGIGGGKYDELTDAISASYFGVAPPKYMIVSGTMRLPLPGFGATETQLSEVRRRARDLQWNPQRLIESQELALERNRLIALPCKTRQQRRERFTLLRRNLDRWQNLIAIELTDAHDRQSFIEMETQADAVLRSRDVSWVLHSEAALRSWLAQETRPGFIAG